jgi:hypothetical protein
MVNPRSPRLARRALCAGAVSLASAPLWAAAPVTVFRPEDFGAKGDGRTNDSAAFAVLGRAVSRNGGGTIVFQAGSIYLVGTSRPAAYPPPPLLEIHGCRKPVVIQGNGAIIRAVPNALFGTFEANGRPSRRPMPNFDQTEIRVPYRRMILIEGCGEVTVRNVELDGMVGNAVVGGGYGDTGRQVAMIGLALVDNAGPELVEDLYSHHHGLDGMMLDGPVYAGATRIFRNVRCEYNGRQGCSVVGGHRYRFENCRFAHTGRSRVSSAPGAGVDIEAEGGKRVSDIVFAGCEFVDNSGPGLLADQGPSSDVSVRDSLLVGTTTWAAWPRKPGFLFERCRFVGAVVNAFGSEDPREATRFVDCTFTDSPAQSANGKVYGSGGEVPIVDLGGSYAAGKNVAFITSRFHLTSGGRLPWTVGSIYQDVTMEQASAQTAYPRGIYRGRNVLNGPIDTVSSRNEGIMIFNGKTFRAGR